jgi:prepilin-type N-terminal cleavage/methylation domain-containing protein
MKRTTHSNSRGGFTLMETVIAIGVLAVLLTAFLAVFTPAAQGIRKAISAEDADRLAFALERELVTVGDADGDYATGFDKAFEWIADADEDPLLIYQFRADPSNPDQPVVAIDGVAGEDFIVVPVVRRASNIAAAADELKALEGRIFAVLIDQLVFDGGELVARDLPGSGQLREPGNADGTHDSAATYPEAYIAFSASFYRVPNSSVGYIQGDKLKEKLDEWKAGSASPIFSRNLAVRR